MKKQELNTALIKTLNSIAKNKNQVNAIKKNLLEKHVLEGVTANIIKNPSSINEIDARLLCLLTQGVYEELQIEELNPEDHFTKSEIKDSTQYTTLLEVKNNHSLLPITLDEVVYTKNRDTYLTTMHVSMINDLLQSGDLFYNFETQREASFKRHKGEIVRTPKINKRAVKSIAEHLLNGTLIQTIIVLNAAPGTSDEDEELVHNEKKGVVEITPGTRLDVLDGFHRIQGIAQALAKNPDLDFWFPVMLTNFSTLEAQKYIGQIAMATPISKAKAKSLTKDRLSDEVVHHLRNYSELKGRISDSERVHHTANEIVSINNLSDSIDQLFKLERKIDAIKVGEYLTKFFDLLFGIYADEFVYEVKETSKDSLINANIMFVGYISLAAKLYKENTELNTSTINNIIKNIDFSKDNPIWSNIGLIDNGKINTTKKTKRELIKYFSNLELVGV